MDVKVKCPRCDFKGSWVLRSGTIRVEQLDTDAAQDELLSEHPSHDTRTRVPVPLNERCGKVSPWDYRQRCSLPLHLTGLHRSHGKAW
jgi:hypothetical protein